MDVFAWSYQDMPSINSNIVVHKWSLQPDCTPVKQKLKRTIPDMALKISEEVKRQFNYGFLVVAKYHQWVANIVPMPKKDNKVKTCVDYRDLNNVSPKDDFPLPHIDTLVDNILNLLSSPSWMDCQAITRPRCLQKIWKIPCSLPLRENFLIRLCLSVSRTQGQLTRE